MRSSRPDSVLGCAGAVNTSWRSLSWSRLKRIEQLFLGALLAGEQLDVVEQESRSAAVAAPATNPRGRRRSRRSAHR